VRRIPPYRRVTAIRLSPWDRTCFSSSLRSTLGLRSARSCISQDTTREHAPQQGICPPRADKKQQVTLPRILAVWIEEHFLLLAPAKNPSLDLFPRQVALIGSELVVVQSKSFILYQLERL